MSVNLLLSLRSGAWRTVKRRSIQFRRTNYSHNQRNFGTISLVPSSNLTTSAAAIEEVPRELEDHHDHNNDIDSSKNFLHSTDEELWRKNLSGNDEHRLVGERTEWWWTGKLPSECPGLRSDNGAMTCLPQPTLENVTRSTAMEYFDNAWTLNELLFAGLQGEEPFYRPPYHGLRHPMIFYYGHTATFYTNKLRVAGLVEEGINSYFEDIFEVGVDEMRWDDLSKNDNIWPTVGEVRDYRVKAHALVEKVINEHLDEHQGVNVTKDHPLWSLFMGVEHDHIHLETSSVLIREMPLKFLREPEHWPLLPENSETNGVKDMDVTIPQNTMLEVAGKATLALGKQTDHPTYGWDNEYGSRSVEVEDFKASKFLVSNGEFAEFVKDGGYYATNDRYWSDAGREWRKYYNRKWPFFWTQRGAGGSNLFGLRTIFKEIDMPWTSAVIVNHHEAEAYLRWKSEKEGKTLRLLTEAEHKLVRETSGRTDPALKHSGEHIADQANCNLSLAFGSETAIDAFNPNPEGFHDVCGNAWCHILDDMNPLEGFEVHPYYEDFTTPCFDGQHSMIMGGSFISAGDNGGNKYSRFHFRPHFLQHSSFRYVEPSRNEIYPGEAGGVTYLDESKKASEDVYETQNSVDQYLALHFGQSGDSVDDTLRGHDGRPNGALMFPQRCASLVERASKLAEMQAFESALDIGCSVGGSTFGLASSFGKAYGMDYSSAFISTANRIKSGLMKPDSDSELSFSIPVEGDSMRKVNVQLAQVQPDMQAVAPRTEFFVGNACEDILSILPTDVQKGKLDAVLMANLLCRLPDPTECLQQMPNIVKKGGIVVLVSPYSWLPEFTPTSNWLQNGEDKIPSLFNDMGFETLFSQDEPLMIREHERKYQYIISHALAFKKL